MGNNLVRGVRHQHAGGEWGESPFEPQLAFELVDQLGGQHVLDVVGRAVHVVGGNVGVLDEDLGCAVRKALKISRTACRDFALGFTWRACAEQFLGNLHPFELGD